MLLIDITETLSMKEEEIDYVCISHLGGLLVRRYCGIFQIPSRDKALAYNVASALSSRITIAK